MNRIIYVFLIAVLLLPLFIQGANARSVEVEYKGRSTEMVVRGYSPIWLNFSLRNIFNRSLDVEINVPYSKDYKMEYRPAQSIRLSPLGKRNVSVVIIPSKNVERAELDLTIKFDIYEVDGVNPIETKESHISILIINPPLFMQPLISLVGNQNDWVIQFLVTVIFWLLVGLLVVYVIGPLTMKIVEKTKTQIDDIVWRIIRAPIIILLFLYGFVAAADLLPIDVSYLILINKLYNFVLVVVITYVSYKIFKDILIYEGHKIAKKTETQLDDVLIPVFEKIGGVIILIVGILWALAAFGIDITLFLAGLGGAALIIGLGAQDVIGNFFAGLHILMDRPFSIGDYIKIEGSNTVYRIEKVGVRSTRAYDVFNHELVIIPNTVLAGDRIINMMKPDEMGKVKFNVGVAYGTDVDKVEKIIEEVVNSHPEIIKTPDKKPLVRLTEFGDSSINFTVIAWIPNIMDQWRIAHELRVELYKKFRKENIEIPFPQLDVHIKEH